MQAEIQLLRAAKKGDYDRVRSAMRNCKTLNCRDQNGYTALHWAAAEGHLNVLKALLHSRRVNIHAKTKSGATALHWASGQGSADAVKQLLMQKGDPRVEDQQGETPLFWACTNAHPQIANLLLVAKAKPSHADRDGCTALEIAEANEQQSKRHAKVFQVVSDAQKRAERSKEAYRLLRQRKAAEEQERRDEAERRAQEAAIRKTRQSLTRRNNMKQSTPVARRSAGVDRESIAAATKRALTDSPSRGRAVWDARERELLTEISELRAQATVEERNQSEHSREMVALRDRETKLMAEVAEMEILINAEKSKMARLQQTQEAEIESVAVGFQRKISSLQDRLANSKDADFHAERLEKSLKEATDMIRTQQAQLEAQNKVAAVHADISAAAQANAAADAEVIDKLSTEISDIKRNMDDMQAAHRRDVHELNDECDTRIAQAEKQALALVEEQSKHDQEARTRELTAMQKKAESEIRNVQQQEAATLHKMESQTRKKMGKIESKLREVEAAALQWETNCQQCEAAVIEERKKLEEMTTEKEKIAKQLEAAESDAKDMQEVQRSRLAEMEQHLEEVERHAEEQLMVMQKKYAAKQERYQAKVAEMKRNSKLMLKSVEGHQHGSAQALQQLSLDLEASQAQEATLYDELQSIHAQYAARDQQRQHTLDLEAQTQAMEHQQQLQEQRLKLAKAAEEQVNAAKLSFEKENEALRKELEMNHRELEQLGEEYARAEEQMRVFSKTMEEQQSKTIREAEVRAQAKQGAQWDEELRVLRRKLEDEAAEAAKQAEETAREQLLDRERQVQEKCQETMDREAAAFESRLSALEQKQQQELAALVVQHQNHTTQLTKTHRAELEEQRTNFRRRRDADAAEWRRVRQALDARIDELQEQLSNVGDTHVSVDVGTDLEDTPVLHTGAVSSAAATPAAGARASVPLRKTLAKHKNTLEDMRAQLFKDHRRLVDNEGQELLDDLLQAAAEAFEEVPIL